MRKLIAVVTGMMLCMPGLASAATHNAKQVATVHSPDARECVFFLLTGVAEADPVVPGSSWFAVSKTHAGFKEIVSILLMARVTKEPVSVVTSGAAACGHAAVHAVVM